MGEIVQNPAKNEQKPVAAASDPVDPVHSMIPKTEQHIHGEPQKQPVGYDLLMQQQQQMMVDPNAMLMQQQYEQQLMMQQMMADPNAMMQYGQQMMMYDPNVVSPAGQLAQMPMMFQEEDKKDEAQPPLPANIQFLETAQEHTQ